jgi:Fe-S cluster biogenesis protein NfuA
MRESVEEVLARVRLCLQVDGGDVELLDVNDGVVTLRLVGGFCGCPMSQMALACGLEDALMKEVEGVKRVVLVKARRGHA